jgi:hypothetical protein
MRGSLASTINTAFERSSYRKKQQNSTCLVSNMISHIINIKVFTQEEEQQKNLFQYDVSDLLCYFQYETMIFYVDNQVFSCRMGNLQRSFVLVHTWE